jgi:folate-binding protein YgfZ
MAVRFADRSDRGKLRVTGPQRAWFLDQVLTQSIEDMATGESREAAMITVHGRMIGHLEVLATDDAFLGHFEPELRPTLPDALTRYLIATDAEVADVTDGYGLLLLLGSGWEDIAARLEAIPQTTTALGEPAGYVWATRDRIPLLAETLAEAGVGPISEAELEALRIQHGIARWGFEMDEKTFPQEARVDERAVHYEKGCYLGQEAMAKIHFRGRVNRRLARVRGEHLEPGMQITVDDKQVGSVTSASNGDGLAIIRYDVEPGTPAHTGGAVVEIVD